MALAMFYCRFQTLLAQACGIIHDLALASDRKLLLLTEFCGTDAALLSRFGGGFVTVYTSNTNSGLAL
jgi:hypothetical protein